MNTRTNIQAWLTASLSDPIVKILAKNSHLTSVQLETLLIDIFSDNMSVKLLKYDEKASFRLMKARVSRGSFNRTLKQAKKNVMGAIYTVILLGYLGVFDSTTLDPYLEIANKLRTYVDACKNATNQGNEPEEHLRTIEILRHELEAGLKLLADTSEIGM